ncbi:hypothetical protein CN354_02225 [Bacillus cereus]|nr:hypothetical protein CN354_02225 [Bacillus cereus]
MRKETIYCSFTISVMVMKPKKDLFSFFHFGFIRHGAKKGPDRIYARADTLSYLKKVFKCLINLINKVKFLHISCIVCYCKRVRIKRYSKGKDIRPSPLKEEKYNDKKHS